MDLHTERMAGFNGDDIKSKFFRAICRGETRLSLPPITLHKRDCYKDVVDDGNELLKIIFQRFLLKLNSIAKQSVAEECLRSIFV